MLFYANSFGLSIEKETIESLSSCIVNAIVRDNETANQITLNNFSNLREEEDEPR
jgi:hypothetical protein